MTTDDFKEIEDAFQKALSLEGDDRISFLAKLERENGPLALRVRQLLKADAGTEDSFAGPIAASVKALAEEVEDPWLGKTIGDWRVLSRIGAGGMGAVFRAERADDEFAQQAALKIMGAQLLDERAALRFRAERQILANLNHPNIASLIDGGSTPDGLPFLVMELVDGTRIDDYCDDKSLSVRDRLALFQQLCNAVDYAHRNLVVHRDLKPSNMLVTESGALKLLDFGIAKLLAADSAALTTALTGEGARILTPEYASPEQVRGEPISVSADVYAMGVLLFRLLTGHSPYGPTVSTAREIEGAILDTDPKKPSASLTNLVDDDDESNSISLDDLGTRRSTTPDRLRHQLIGDLDNIVLKCLQKDPDRRYATVRALADDVENYLCDKPVAARGDSWTYKTKKFLVRNARPVIAATAALVVLLGTASFYTVRLAEERDAAELAATEAKEVSGFLSEIFKNAAPRVSQGKEVTAIELLDQAESQIESLAGQPLLEGKLLTIIGSSLNGLGSYERASVTLERAVAKLEPYRSSHGEDVGAAYSRLAEAQRHLGKYDESIQNRQIALSIFKATLGENHPQLADTHNTLGATLAADGRCEEAIPEYQASVALLENASDHYASLKNGAAVTWAVCLDTLGRYQEAEDLYRKITPEIERVSGTLHPNTISHYSNLGLVLARQWKLSEAVASFKTAVERGDKVWPEGNLEQTIHKQYLVIMLGRLGKFSDAVRLQKEITESTRSFDGEESIAYAVRLYGWGNLHRGQGDLETAAEYYRQSAALAMRLYGDTGAYTIMSRIYLGQTYFEQGNLEDAERLLSKVSEHLDRIGTDHRVNAKLLLAGLYAQTGRGPAADTLISEVLSIKSDIPPLDPSWAILLPQISKSYRQIGKTEEATELSKRAHEISTQSLPKGNWYAALATAEYAYALAASGNLDDAKKHAADAHAALSANFGPDDYRLVGLSEVIRK